MTDRRPSNPGKRRRAGTGRKPRSLQPDERRALLDQPSRRYPTGRRNKAIIAVMLRAGLRCAETLNLRMKDVSLRERRLFVVAGKGDKDRVVPIDPVLEEYLRLWLDVRPSGPRFFLTLHGSPLDDRYVRRMVARYGRKAEIPHDVHPHLLRHTCATVWHEERHLSTRKIQTLLGHAKLSTTEGYLHVRVSEIVDEFQAFTD